MTSLCLAHQDWLPSNNLQTLLVCSILCDYGLAQSEVAGSLSDLKIFVDARVSYQLMTINDDREQWLIPPLYKVCVETDRGACTMRGYMSAYGG